MMEEAYRLRGLSRFGRHRYFRIAGAGEAAAIEGLMNIAPPSKRPID